MPRSPSHARDAALSRMRRINRWLIAGTVVLAGLLTDVAAQAFPGRTIKRTSGSSSTTRGGRPLPATTTTHRRHTDQRAAHRALKPAAQAPQPQVIEPVPGATSAPSTSPPATSAPAPPAPVQSAPAPAPAPIPAPVVSGGS